MLRVLLFDLGLTLVDAQQQPFPHVADALRTIQRFLTPEGGRLLTAIVSDFDMAIPPATPAKVKKILDRYLTILDGTGLRPFFEPVHRRITLSTHAGVFKPDRAIFTTALRRLRTTATLEDCLLVTENTTHVTAARTQLNMRALQFRGDASPAFDFDDWLQAPSMVAQMLDGGRGRNSEAALRRFLDIGHAFELKTMDLHEGGASTLAIRGTLWKPVAGTDGANMERVLAPFPAEGTVTLGSAGDIRTVRFEESAANDATETASFMRSLNQHGQLEGSSSPLGDQSTHSIETDDQGRRKLVRKRFRAF